MSRGGRGGGRGGFVSSASRLNNGTLPFEIGDLEDSLEEFGNNSAELYPTMQRVPSPTPLTKEELEVVNGYRRFRSKIRAGPFWGALNPDFRVGKNGKRTKPAVEYNAFENAPTWSNRHSGKRGLTKLSDYSFVKEHFPKELWHAIGVAEDGSEGPMRKKKFTLSTADALARFDERADADEGTSKDVDAGEDDDGNPKERDKDEDAVSVQQDDDFEDDEDDMGNDYNAEQYFDGGDDDVEEFGGDDGGGDEAY